MATKIDKKIVAFKVVKDEDKEAEAKAAEPQEPVREHMHENVERPDMLLGSTYKIKTPLSEHALYVTINDVVLNQALITNNASLTKYSSTQKAWITSSG